MPQKRITLKTAVKNFVDKYGYKPHGNNKNFKELMKKYNVKSFQSRKARREFLIKVVDDRQKLEPSKKIQRFLKKSVERNKIFKIEPTNSSFNSYKKYTINNTKPNLFTKYESIGQYDYIEVFDIGTVKDFIEFYQIDSFISSKAGSKIWLEGIYLTDNKNEEDQEELIETEKNVTTKARVILTSNDTM